jgi:hypothetical protein
MLKFLEQNCKSNAPINPNGFFVGFFAFFHLIIELNIFFAFDFFSILQSALVNKIPYTLVVQISNQLKNISDFISYI